MKTNAEGAMRFTICSGCFASLAVALLTAAVATTAAAQVPSVLNFSGRLATTTGDYAGTATITLRLWSDATAEDDGHLLWTESQEVFVDAGRFHVLLGADPGNPLPDEMLLAPDLFVGVQVGDTPELTPRMRVASVPWALHARDASALQGHGPGDFATVSHGHDGFAAVAHSHDGFAPTSHVHDYAATAHTHAGFAAEGHAHAAYAAVAHSHDGFAALAHSHAFADLTGTAATSQLPAAVVLDAELTTALATKSDVTHGHADHSLAGHEHATYAPLTHAHAGYAVSSHTHDAAYVNEGQTGSITSAMVADGSLLAADLADWGCAGGQVIEWNSDAGAWACGSDDGGTQYLAGTGLALNGATFSVQQATIQGWAKAVCYDTADELYAALDARYAATGHSHPGGATGTVTQVATGAGLTGGPITTTGTISVAAGGITNAMIQNPGLTIAPGAGLTGGGSVLLGGTATLALPTTGATPGSYPLASATVDAYGRVTSISSTTLAASDVPAGSAHYVQNGTTEQAGASFNVAGSGRVGSSLTVGGYADFAPKTAAPTGATGRVYFDDATKALMVHNGTDWTKLGGGGSGTGGLPTGAIVLGRTGNDPDFLSAGFGWLKTTIRSPVRAIPVGGGWPSSNTGCALVAPYAICWGGRLSSGVTNTGTRFHTTARTWSATSIAPGCPALREYHTVVGGGSVLVVWGGRSSGNPSYGDGGRYHPEIGTDGAWEPVNTLNAPGPRYSHTAVWTGSKMIVWGGERASYGTLNDGGSYDPTTDKWSALAATTLAIRKNHSAIWTGTEMIIWGGYGQAVHATGAAYNPTTDSWRAIAAPPSGFPQRHQHVAVWTGTEMLIAGGRQYSDSGETTAAAAYDPATDTWRILAPAPSSLLYHGVVWTGTEVLVSASNLTVYSYDPALDIWTTLTAPGTATSGTSGAAIWLQGLLFTGAQTLFDPGTVFYPYAKQ